LNAQILVQTVNLRRAPTLRRHGVATSIRLETLYWQLLEKIGKRNGLSVNQLIT